MIKCIRSKQVFYIATSLRLVQLHALKVFIEIAQVSNYIFHLFTDQRVTQPLQGLIEYLFCRCRSSLWEFNTANLPC